MSYECQGCGSIFESEDLEENSLGDPRCPDCGSVDLTDAGSEDLFDSDMDLEEDIEDTKDVVDNEP